MSIWYSDSIMMGLFRNSSKSFRRIVHQSYFSKRYDVINYFGVRLNAQSYLEIGINRGRCLERVSIPEKTGVDPSPQVSCSDWKIHATTSDEFFSTNTQRFDVVFIDGLHFAEQVIKDIRNSLAALKEGGVILLHDCNPCSARQATRVIPEQGSEHWNGDSWKAMAFFHQRFSSVFSRVLNLDEGIGVILPTSNLKLILDRLDGAIETEAERWFRAHDWSDLDADREGMLGLIGNRKELEKEFRRADIAI